LYDHSIGLHTRCVADAAAVLSTLAGMDALDAATQAAKGKAAADYTRFRDADGLRGARIGVARNLGFGPSPKTDAVMEAAIRVMRAAGAEIVDPADFPSGEKEAEVAEWEVLLYEFKADINQYLATRREVALDREGFERSLAGLIAFNEAHRAEELKFFGQDIFLQSQAKGDLSAPAYLAALETSRRLSGAEGLDAVMDKYRLDALVAPTGAPAPPIDLVNGERGIGCKYPNSSCNSFPQG
jgi:amidase